MVTSQLLTELKQITQSNIDLVKSKLVHLSDDQKNWKKDRESWNINEIFAHLNQYADFYHHTIREKIQKTRFREPKEIFLSSPLGRSAWKSMKLGNARNVKRKFKAPKGSNPVLHPELLKGDQLERFTTGQRALMELLDDCANVNLRKVRIPISISKIVRLRLGDALMFIIYHNERHVQQALNVLAQSKFPSN